MHFSTSCPDSLETEPTTRGRPNFTLVDLLSDSFSHCSCKRDIETYHKEKLHK